MDYEESKGQSIFGPNGFRLVVVPGFERLTYHDKVGLYVPDDTETEVAVGADDKKDTGVEEGDQEDEDAAEEGDGADEDDAADESDGDGAGGGDGTDEGDN